MNTLHPYLTFLHTCEEAFLFYQSILGGELTLSRFGDMPPQDNMPVSDEMKNKVMHCTLKLPSASILMGSDWVAGNGPALSVGNNFTLSLDVKSRQEAERIMDGLSQGGHITMPLADTFWGAYFGMWVDKFGIAWIVNYDDPAHSVPH